MQFFKNSSYLNSSIFVFSRETPKMVFFKKLLPNRHVSGRTEGILYISMSDKYDFKQFDLNNPILSDEETRMLKTKCNMKLLTQEEIDHINNSFIFNDVNFRNTENNLFMDDDAENEIKKAYELEHYCKSLTSPYIRRQVHLEAINDGVSFNYHCTKNFNVLLQKLKMFYNDNKTFIDDNINKISNTIYWENLANAHSINYDHLENILHELLNKQPLPMNI